MGSPQRKQDDRWVSTKRDHISARRKRAMAVPDGIPSCSRRRASVDEGMVGARGFEPPAPASRTLCSAKLSYTPILVLYVPTPRLVKPLFSSLSRTILARLLGCLVRKPIPLPLQYGTGVSNCKAVGSTTSPSSVTRNQCGSPSWRTKRGFHDGLRWCRTSQAT